jgi:hypothetical protein
MKAPLPIFTGEEENSDFRLTPGRKIILFTVVSFVRKKISLTHSLNASENKITFTLSIQASPADAELLIILKKYFHEKNRLCISSSQLPMSCTEGSQHLVFRSAGGS